MCWGQQRRTKPDSEKTMSRPLADISSLSVIRVMMLLGQSLEYPFLAHWITTSWFPCQRTKLKQHKIILLERIPVYLASSSHRFASNASIHTQDRRVRWKGSGAGGGRFEEHSQGHSCAIRGDSTTCQARVNQDSKLTWTDPDEITKRRERMISWLSMVLIWRLSHGFSFAQAMTTSKYVFSFLWRWWRFCSTFAMCF